MSSQQPRRLYSFDDYVMLQLDDGEDDPLRSRPATPGPSASSSPLAAARGLAPFVYRLPRQLPHPTRLVFAHGKPAAEAEAASKQPEAAASKTPAARDLPAQVTNSSDREMYVLMSDAFEHYNEQIKNGNPMIVNRLERDLLLHFLDFDAAFMHANMEMGRRFITCSYEGHCVECKPKRECYQSIRYIELVRASTFKAFINEAGSFCKTCCRQLFVVNTYCTGEFNNNFLVKNKVVL